jgi:DNA-binding response OmpR family regulator
MYKILLVEDDDRVSRLLELQLKREGYSVDIAKDGFDGLLKFNENEYDLILLDYMLPKVNGLEVLKKIREKSEIPILMVTAKDELTDRITGLDLGANDYIIKPFEYSELSARIRVNLRHLEKKEKKLEYLGINMELDSMEVTKDGEKIELSKTEFELLKLLLENKGIVLTREKILGMIWGDSYYGNPNVLEVYIRYLRNKLGSKGKDSIIKTIRGVGYSLKS